MRRERSKSAISVNAFGILTILVLALTSCQPAPQQAPTAQGAPTSTQKLPVVAFAHTGPVTDMGWTWSHDEGRKALEAAFPGIKTLTVESMPYSDEATRTIEGLVSQGARIVFVTSGYSDYLYKVAEAHPDVKFYECGGSTIPHDANLLEYFVQEEYPAYLIGMAAGYMTKSNKLGYVGAFPGWLGDVNAFEMGARSVNPNAVTEVVFVNSWYDPTAETQASNALIDDGVDFLYGIMDDPTYLQVAEKRNVWAAMWNTDMRTYGPDVYVSSILLNWNAFYVSEVKSYMDGTWKGDRYVWLPLGQGVDRDKWGQNVPLDVQQKVDAVRTNMLAGYTPFVGPIQDADGKEQVSAGHTMTEYEILAQWNWPVQGVQVKQ